MTARKIMHKDYRTWWRVILEDYEGMAESVEWPGFKYPYIGNDDDVDCVIEQLWAEREGLA
jgi:hypothetical protein